VFESIFVKYSPNDSKTKLNLFSDFFTFLSPYFKTSSSIMKFILNSSNFLNYFNVLTSKDFTPNKSNSFQKCFKFFDYKEYSLSTHLFDILLKYKLIKSNILSLMKKN
jgi:hypothetical protein